MFGLAMQLDGRDVLQRRRRADALDEESAQATAAILRRDDHIEHLGDVGAIREHPGERGEGVGPLLDDREEKVRSQKHLLHIRPCSRVAPPLVAIQAHEIVRLR